MILGKAMIPSERKRKRVAMSCIMCRRRKIRCNRESPCSNCVRSKNVACLYEAEMAKKAYELDLQNARVAASETPLSKSLIMTTLVSSPASTISTLETSAPFGIEDMRKRIAELEEKLSQMDDKTPTHSTAASSPPLTHPVHITTSIGGSIDVLQDSRVLGDAHAISRGIAHKNRVFGQSHWMNGFVVLRDLIEWIEPKLWSGSSTVLSTLRKAKALARLLKDQRFPDWPTSPTRDLPPKDICDTLIDGYLGTVEALYRILHIPSFSKEYGALWDGNMNTPSGFTVLLKLVLAIGASVYDKAFSMRTQALKWVFEAQTWISSPTIKSQLGIQYMQINLLLILAREALDAGSELIWISTGSALHTAMYIGLHKDPTCLPKMTILEAEIRRRIWNTLLEILLQASLQSGGSFPISPQDYSTEPPGNFNDEDLMAVDPVVKPGNTYTQTSIAVALRETLNVRVAVVRFLNEICSTGTYEETLAIDNSLRAAYKSLRDTLQRLNSNASSAPSTFALQSVEFIMQRYISSLHVPFLGPSLQNPVHAFSRKAVVDASLKIWKLSSPPADLREARDESDFVRLCRNSAGFFRASVFHASVFLAIDLRARAREDDDISSSLLCSASSTMVDDASSRYLGCIESGETGIKGYLLLQLLGAQINSIQRRVDANEMPGLLVKTADEAAEKAVGLLETMVRREQGTEDAVAMEDFDMVQSAQDFMADWDSIMSDPFGFAGEGRLDSFFV